MREQKKRIRRPKDIHTGDTYAGYAPGDYRSIVYIGGPYYAGSAQIHVPVKDVAALARYLTRMAEWLKSREIRRSGK